MSTDDPPDGVALCLSGGGYRAMLFHGKDDLASRLDAFGAGVRAKGRRFEIGFRDEAALGLRIDLADPLA